MLAACRDDLAPPDSDLSASSDDEEDSEEAPPGRIEVYDVEEPLPAEAGELEEAGELSRLREENERLRAAASKAEEPPATPPPEEEEPGEDFVEAEEEPEEEEGPEAEEEDAAVWPDRASVVGRAVQVKDEDTGAWADGVIADFEADMDELDGDDGVCVRFASGDEDEWLEYGSEDVRFVKPEAYVEPPTNDTPARQLDDWAPDADAGAEDADAEEADEDADADEGDEAEDEAADLSLIHI